MITDKLRATATVLAAVILCVTLAALPAVADEDLMIFNAIVDDAAGEITINGADFPKHPFVTFDGEEAVIVGTPTESEIVIELPSGTKPATYRITVGEDWDDDECFDDNDCFEVAVFGPADGGPKTVFVTSGGFNGDLKTRGGALTGLRGGDALCQAAAEDGVVPPGTYIAWLSTDQKDAIDRLPANTSGYILPNGTQVAASKAALVSGSLDNKIDQNERGDTLSIPRGVFTGTFADGTSHPDNCNHWTTSVFGTNRGRGGNTSRKNAEWTNLGAGTCDSSNRLYCFQR